MVLQKYDYLSVLKKCFQKADKILLRKTFFFYLYQKFGIAKSVRKP